MSAFPTWMKVWGAVLVLGVIAVAGSKLSQSLPSAAQPTSAPASPQRQRPISVGYDELARFPERYRGKAIVFTGKVVQALYENDGPLLRVQVRKDEHGWWDWNSIMLVKYRDQIAGDGRILENDIVEFRGVFKGRFDYKAILGQTINQPGMTACDVRVISNAYPRPARDCT